MAEKMPEPAGSGLSWILPSFDDYYIINYCYIKNSILEYIGTGIFWINRQISDYFEDNPWIVPRSKRGAAPAPPFHFMNQDPPQVYDMRIISAPNLARAHELVVKTVLEKGWLLCTEDGEATIECEELAVQIENPTTEPMISTGSRFQRRFMEKYASDLLQGSDGVFEYDYHGRLFAWGDRLAVDDAPVEVDQVAYIVRKLQEAPASRRALAITWNPVVDEEVKDCPCLQLVQCVIRDGALQMKVVFRSNDMLTASGANMFALVHLQQMIAERLGVGVGRYTHIALVPHVYFTRDMDDLKAFCNKGERFHPIQEVCSRCNGCSRAASRPSS